MTDPSRLLIGPSTNVYVGPKRRHYTIPKRLFYYFSDYAKPCLESEFSEARTNALWLSDVDPDVFQWLWQWLYTGKLKVWHYCDNNWGQSVRERRNQACQILCRLHILGERLLFDYRFLSDVERQIDKIIEEAKTSKDIMPLSPETVENVLADSAPVECYDRMNWTRRSLRPFVLRNVCSFQFCTTVDFMDYANCFERDGAFAAEIMAFMADETRWGVKLWGAQIDWPVDIAEQKWLFAEERIINISGEGRTEKGQGVWSAMKTLCTSAGCTRKHLRGFSPFFESDGAFTADVLNYMAAELRWVIKRWGEDRGEEVDVTAEREEEERIAEEESLFQDMVDRIIRRDGWT